MACLFLKARLIDEDTRVEPMLSGGAKSLAASLDYALAKQPSWIVDMFGLSSHGKARARRLFCVTNSHRKRGGPVCVSLNLNVCPKDHIEVVLDGKLIDAPETLCTMLETIEAKEKTAGSASGEESRITLYTGALTKNLEAA
jgi:hypothetical protein